MESSADLPKMYRQVAGWFHLLTPPEEYAVEAGIYERLITDHAEVAVTSILELGSGGGNNASHLKKRFDLTLVDLSEQMLEISRSINPELEHIQGDMRTLRLGRLFDGVFVHDAVVYMVTEDDLRAAIATAYEHCRPGGVALFAPDDTKETFEPRTDHGGIDGGGRGLRYLEWVWDPDPADDVYLADYAYLLRDELGDVTIEYDRHVCAAWPRALWMRLLEEAGFQPQRKDGIPNETGPDLFVGVRPSAA